MSLPAIEGEVRRGNAWLSVRHKLGWPLIIVAAVAITASCAGSRRTGGLTGVTNTKAVQSWIINATELERIHRYGMSREQLRPSFNTPGTFLIVRRSRSVPDPLVPHATLVLGYTSAAALAGAARRHEIAPDIRCVLLDLERWPLSPVDEQERPIAALRTAAAAAHADGKCIIFTPALDLLPAIGIRSVSPANFYIFNRLIIRPAARIVDVLEIQAQHTEGTRFVEVFAPAAVRAAKSANPSVKVFVGLSTNPNGRHVTVADLLALVKAGRSAGANGYWLNVPETGLACPKCGRAQTWAAVGLLRELSRWTAGGK